MTVKLEFNTIEDLIELTSRLSNDVDKEKQADGRAYITNIANFILRVCSRDGEAHKVGMFIGTNVRRFDLAVNNEGLWDSLVKEAVEFIMPEKGA